MSKEQLQQAIDLITMMHESLMIKASNKAQRQIAFKLLQVALLMQDELNNINAEIRANYHEHTSRG